MDTSTTIQSALDFLPFLPLILVGGGILLLIAVNYAPKVMDYISWRNFGQRMKKAYEAKFGGRNEEFDREVDNRIAAMQYLENGQTRQQTVQWLKSHARFVEIPYPKFG